MTTQLAAQLKQFDYDRYLCSLFAPNSLLEPLFILYNLNLEIASIGTNNTDYMVGLIRLQWWKDAISDLYQERKTSHPLLQELAKLIKQFNLPEQSFLKLITSREFDLETENPKNIHQIENYAENSCGILFELALRILQVTDKRIQKMASHLGIAWAVIGHIRALPYNPLSARLIMPECLLEQYELKIDQVRLGEEKQKISKIIVELVDMVEDHLSYILVAKHLLPRQALPVFLLATLLKIYIKRIKKSQFNPWQHDLEGSRLYLQLKVLLAGITGRI